MSEHSHREFQEISPNPYIVGNPVRDRSMFFGRNAEFEYVRKRFHGSAHGLLLVFCGERRSGKTSILFQVLDGRLGEDFIPVLIDMQSMAIRDEGDFLSRIAEEILHAVESAGIHASLPDFRSGSMPSETFRAFMQEILTACPSKKPILMFDEYELFEDKIDKGILTEELLRMFCYLMEQKKVFLVFTGSQHLEKRQRPYWKILGAADYRPVSYLQHDGALSLIRNPVAGRVSYAEGTDEEIYRLTAGQPFYTQAICQRLVDQLNELRTNEATQEILADVVKEVVRNPYPQMVFLWEGLDRDEKLALALLAELLKDGNETASAKELSELLKAKYPISIGVSNIATALENLFGKELLTKTDSLPGRYAFRMDVWRRWVRVMHSPWQVLRELDIPIRPRKPLRPAAVVAGAVLLIAAIVAASNYAIQRWRSSNGAVTPPSETVNLSPIKIDIPDEARIYMDGEPKGAQGQDFDQYVQPGIQHEVRVEAKGYADTTFTLDPLPGQGQNLTIPALRSLYGFISVITEPAGARVTCLPRRLGNATGPEGGRDGTTLQSPNALFRRQAEWAYQLRATLQGYEDAMDSVIVVADTTVTRVLRLHQTLVLVTVNAYPPEAEIYLADTLVGRRQATISLPMGPHKLGARREGYVPIDSNVVVTKEMPPIFLSLTAMPPGDIVFTGHIDAVSFYLDDKRVGGGTSQLTIPNLKPGRYKVRVELRDRSVDSELEVVSGYQTEFNFSTQKARQILRGGT